MKNVILPIISLFLATQSYASIYVGGPGDALLVDGHSVNIHECPIENYIRYSCDINRLIEYDDKYGRPHNSDAITRLWEIQNDKLYLVSIKTYKTKEEYLLNKLFPDAQGAVFASWYSGTIKYSFGDIFIHGETFFREQEMVIQIVNGKVQKQFSINHKQRCLLYAEQFLKQQFPLAKSKCPKLYTGSSNRKRRMTDFLTEAFSSCEMKGPTSYAWLSSIRIKITANIDHFNHKRGSHQNLSCYELLKLVAQETDTTLDVSIVEGDVVYEIKESEPVE